MEKMPVLFVGHGSPMNAIEDNAFTRNWIKIAREIPKPAAILSISAHWYTSGIRIMDETNPKTVYDMYGFPKELYEVVYSPAGAPEMARLAKNLITKETVFDNTWGFDHGTWSVLVHMYPQKDIPVFQISVDGLSPAGVHFEIGRNLRLLREKGVLILGSGNVAHNLRLIDWSMKGGYEWAYEFDNYVKDNILKNEFKNVVDYQKAGDSTKLAVPTPDHFYPLLYILGSAEESDQIKIYNDECVMGSLSMTSYLFI